MILFQAIMFWILYYLLYIKKNIQFVHINVTASDSRIDNPKVKFVTSTSGVEDSKQH